MFPFQVLVNTLVDLIRTSVRNPERHHISWWTVYKNLFSFVWMRESCIKIKPQWIPTIYIQRCSFSCAGYEWEIRPVKPGNGIWNSQIALNDLRRVNSPEKIANDGYNWSYLLSWNKFVRMIGLELIKNTNIIYIFSRRFTYFSSTSTIIKSQTCLLVAARDHFFSKFSSLALITNI